MSVSKHRRATTSIRTITVVSLTAMLSSCAWFKSPAPVAQPAAQPAPQTQVLPNDGTNQLLTMINEARRKKRSPLLVVDPRLTRAAKAHSNAMAKHKFFAHKGLDGSHFQARMQRQGYPLSHSAENLAMAHDAQTAFNMWWESKGHRANMMNKKYTRVGIVRTGKYWTANYAAPDGT